MKTPTLEEVKEHFKDAKTIKCIWTGVIVGYNENIFWEDGEPWIKTKSGDDINIWDRQLGYAEIVEYKYRVTERITNSSPIYGSWEVKTKPMETNENNTEITMTFETVGGVEVMLTGNNIDNLVTIANMIK